VPQGHQKEASVRIPIIVITALLISGPAFAQKQDVTITGKGGVNLQGTYETSGKTSPGFLLLHPCGATRRVYENLAGFLSMAGYSVLSFDMRPDAGSGLTAGDIDAALAFLSSRKEVNATRLGIIAGDCSVGHALRAAQRHAAVKALVLMAGTGDAAGEEHIRASKMPVLGIASEENADHAAAVKRIVSASTNPDSKLTLVKGAGPASTMLAKAPDLETEIVIWLRSSFPVASYAPLK
jgi:pimeloyl-ACP methyl ester carboxylesterase